MRTKRFLAVALFAPAMVFAQGRGQHSGGSGTQSSYHPAAPIPPTPIGLQSLPGIYTGISNTPSGIYTGIRSGVYGTNGAIAGGSVRYGLPNGFRNAPVRNREHRGYGLPFYPIFGGGYYGNDPSLYSDPVAEQSAEVSANMLGEQVMRLTAEVEALRDERAQMNYPPVAQDSAASTPAPPVILVLRNGQTLTVKSYAVMNGELWDFSNATSHRIPIANIDIAASEKATEAAGGAFPELTGRS